MTAPLAVEEKAVNCVALSAPGVAVETVDFSVLVKTGCVSVGVVSEAFDAPSKSAAPVPFSSERTARNCALVVAANWLSGFDVSASPTPVSAEPSPE